MTDRELLNLQVYIGKRTRNQTDDQVIAHINDINEKNPLSQEEWKKLIYPSCNKGDIVVLKYILSHIVELTDVNEYMKHTVNGRNIHLTAGRIEVLNELVKYLKADKVECLSETMITAGWFGNTAIVKFLIEAGADKNCKTKNGIGLDACADRVEQQFKDDSLKLFLKNL